MLVLLQHYYSEMALVLFSLFARILWWYLSVCMCNLYYNLIIWTYMDNYWHQLHLFPVAYLHNASLGLMLCLHLTGHYHPSLTSMSCVLRCSPAPTIEPTMRLRGAEELSRLHQQDIPLSRYKAVYCLSRWLEEIFSYWYNVAMWDMCCVFLCSCVDTQRGSRSPSRFSLEQLTTDQSGHIRSIRYTGRQPHLFVYVLPFFSHKAMKHDAC